METDVIQILRTKTTADNQLVLVNGYLVCKFMWFYNEDSIDLQPIKNITILNVHRKNWHRIELINQH